MEEQAARAAAPPAWAEAQFALRAQMDAWIREAMARQGPIPWLGTTDESTFMLTWVPYSFLTGDEEIHRFLLLMRGKFLEWAAANLRHGYYPSAAEEHHQTEDFKRVLGRLWYLDGRDDLNRRILEDVAHHFGNWVKGVPPWYDWEKHRFRSRFIGTAYVDPAPEHNWNSPGFFRYCILLIQAYLATGLERYLELCTDYADAWCRLLSDTPEGAPFPTKVDADWRALETAQDPSAAFLNGGFVAVLTDLFILTGRERYAAMAARALRGCWPAGQAAPGELLCAHLGAYRLATGDKSFDERILKAAAALPTHSLEEALSVTGATPHFDLHAGAVGPDGEFVRCRRGGPGLLTLAYQVAGDPDYMARALSGAARRLELARAVGDDGRTHGCASGNTSGVALGAVLPCLFPATLGMVGVASRGTGHHKPLLLYFGPGGALGLPAEVAALLEFTHLDERRVRLFNRSEEPRVVRVAAVDGLMRRRFDGVPWCIGRPAWRHAIEPQYPWEQVASLVVRLAPMQERTIVIRLPQQE